VKDLIDTTEMYLRTIYDLEEEGVRPLRARIAERLEQSGPTVSQTVARMERDGLLLVACDRRLKLTEKGRELAVSVMRKRLTDVPPGWPTAVVVRRLAEHVQSDPDVIGQLRAAGVVPDAHVTVEARPGSVTITVSGHSGFDL
jgi:DNA-binding MarR family transcriptional regulator